MENTKNLFQRLAKVRTECNFIKKQSVGENLKYKAVSSDMVLSAINNSINDNGLFLMTEIVKETMSKEVKRTQYWNSQKKMNEEKDVNSYTSELEIKYTWVNIDKPEDQTSIKWSCSAVNTDPAKANGAALTYSEKYFILKFFNMVSSENEKLDPDCQAVPDEKPSKPESKPVEQPKKTTDFSTSVPVKEISKVTNIEKGTTAHKIITLLDELIKNKDTFISKVQDLVNVYITTKDIDLNSYDWFTSHYQMLCVNNKLGMMDQASFNKAVGG